MRITLLSLLAVMLGLNLNAQTKLLDIGEDDATDNYGRRSKHFVEPNLGYSAYFFNNEDGPQQNVFGSHDFHFGLRYRYLLASRFAIGAELALHQEQYNLDEDETGLYISDNDVFFEPDLDKRMFSTSNVEGSVFLRLLNKENMSGKTKAVDIAYVFGYRYRNTFTTEQELDNGTVLTKAIRDYDEIVRGYSAVEVRLVLQRVGFTARYRLNPFLENAGDDLDEFFWREGQDLSPFTMGVQFNIF